MDFKSAAEETKLGVPADLAEALAATPEAEANWNDLTPIARRDFVSWIDEAKQAPTRKRRIERACENLAKGKRRPCCYAVVPMDFYKALGADPKAKAQWSILAPNERRDFTDWINAAEDRGTRKERIEEACAQLGTGEHHPVT